MGKLLDSMENYFKNGSKKQFLKDWEELKHYNETGPDILEIINGYIPTQPLFTLTAEELDVVQVSLSSSKYMLEKAESTLERDIAMDDIDSILTRIEEWKGSLNSRQKK